MSKKNENETAESWEPTVDSLVLVLTPTYHWVGKITKLDPVKMVLSKATFFVDLGQADAAVRGEFSSEAHGRLLGEVEIPRLSAQIIRFRGASLPEKPIGS